MVTLCSQKEGRVKFSCGGNARSPGTVRHRLENEGRKSEARLLVYY